jgi:guanylate kinase
VLSAPSGAGKTTLAALLRQRNPDVAFSVSATTRPPRAGELPGVHYHFVARDEFQRMAAEGELLEWAEVHGNLYGTPLRNVREAQARGQHLLLDIDVQGARQIRQSLPEAVMVFVLPPSGRVLVERLAARGTEASGVRERRLRNAEQEIQAATGFDHVVVNDTLEHAVTELEAVLRGRAGPPRPGEWLHQRIAAICGEIDAELGPPGPLNHPEEEAEP